MGRHRVQIFSARITARLTISPTSLLSSMLLSLLDGQQSLRKIFEIETLPSRRRYYTGTLTGTLVVDVDVLGQSSQNQPVKLGPGHRFKWQHTLA